MPVATYRHATTYRRGARLEARATASPRRSTGTSRRSRINQQADKGDARRRPVRRRHCSTPELSTRRRTLGGATVLAGARLSCTFTRTLRLDRHLPDQRLDVARQPGRRPAGAGTAGPVCTSGGDAPCGAPSGGRPCGFPSCRSAPRSWGRSGRGGRRRRRGRANPLASSPVTRPISMRSSGLMKPSERRNPPARAIASRRGTAQWCSISSSAAALSFGMSSRTSHSAPEKTSTPPSSAISAPALARLEAGVALDAEPDEGADLAAELDRLVVREVAQVLNLDLAVRVLVDRKGVDDADRVARAQALELRLDLAVELGMLEPEHRSAEQARWPCRSSSSVVGGVARLLLHGAVVEVRGLPVRWRSGKRTARLRAPRRPNRMKLDPSDERGNPTFTAALP